MKKTVLFFGLLLGWSQVGLGATAQPQGDAAAGKGLAVTCGACHGADGNSAVPTFPKLAGQGEKYLYKQMIDIRDGNRQVPTMAGQLDGKSDQEVADLAAWFASQPRGRGQTDPKLQALGEQIYRSGIAERQIPACTACHSPTGSGNAPAGFPALSGQHAEYIAAQLQAYRKGYQDPTGRTNDGDTKLMRSVAFELSDLEIQSVASYAAGLY